MAIPFSLSTAETWLQIAQENNYPYFWGDTDNQRWTNLLSDMEDVSELEDFPEFRGFWPTKSKFLLKEQFFRTTVSASSQLKIPYENELSRKYCSESCFDNNGMKECDFSHHFEGEMNVGLRQITFNDLLDIYSTHRFRHTCAGCGKFVYNVTLLPPKPTDSQVDGKLLLRDHGGRKF